MTNLRLALARGLTAAALALILTYLLGAQALLQSPYAEPAHNFLMSLISPMQRNAGNNMPTEQELHSQPQMQGVIANNVLGGRAGAAGGLAAVVLYGVSALAAAAFIISWKQKSFLLAALLVVSGIVLMIPTLIATGFLAVIMIPGPILGFIAGLILFGLGVTKGIRTPKTTTVKTIK